MDSDSKNIEEKDSVTKQIADYYKKYSKNRELPKYFSGTSVSYLPDVKDDLETTEVVVKTDINILITAPETSTNPEPVDNLDTSSASSVASNRKLEWDNGADIGYGNCAPIKPLHKSSSLPVLSDLQQRKVDFVPVANVEAEQSGSTDSNVKIVILTHSSTSDSQSVGDNVYSSSSQQSSEGKEKNLAPLSSTSSSGDKVLSRDIDESNSTSGRSSKQREFVEFLKRKIGMPGAHSTPKYPEVRLSDPEIYASESKATCSKKSSEVGVKVETPRTSKSEDVLPQDNLKRQRYEQPNKTSVSEKITPHAESNVHVIKLRKKVVNLVITKPISVECTGSIPSLQQTPLPVVTKQSTIAVQTDDISEKELVEILHATEDNRRNQSLIYFEYSESDKTNACSTQTNSEIIASNCDSFEYLKNSPEPKRRDVANMSSKTEKSTSEPADGDTKSHKMSTEPNLTPSNLKRSQRTSDLRTVTSKSNSSESSKDFCLGNAVSISCLDNIGEDIEKSVLLLQKLLKSKKYDPVTKKRYVKKIILKLTESKYLDESSTSSDLFVPKKSKDLKLPSGKDKSYKTTLQSNHPWYPAPSQHQKKITSPKRNALVIKTFTQNFLPDQNPSSREESSPPETIPVDARDTRKNRFTITNSERGYKTQDVKSDGTPCSYKTDSTSLEKQYESSCTSKSDYQNWRDDKTRSEEKREEVSGSNGNGDCLVQFAEKERAFQINWINNEISHLGKLKGLLEKPKTDKISTSNFKTTTTVYTVSEESNKPPHSKTKLKHNYVIQTVLGTQSSDQMNFKFNGKNFAVQEPSATRNHERKTRVVTGDIQVVSSDDVTNIKVTTFCDTCKRAPCVCTIDNVCECEMENGINISQHNVLSTENICQKCKKYPCICSSSSSSASTVCLICHRTPCVCKTTALLKKCSKCGMYPCICSKDSNLDSKGSLSDEYTGTFIPAFIPTFVQKFATFPISLKDDVRENDKVSEKCSVCGKCPCICELQKLGVQGTGSVVKAVRKNSETQNGSLKRVFDNCACSTQTDCSCNFVEKLIGHFSNSDIPSSTLKALNWENKNLQTGEEQHNSQHISTQTHVIAENQNLQTEKSVRYGLGNQISQTDETSRFEYQHIGIQTHADTRHGTSQTSNYVDVSLDVKESFSLQSRSTQVVNVDEKTQTALMSSDARKGVSFDRKPCDHCLDQLKKKKRICTCGATLTNSRRQSRSQSEGSRPTSSSSRSSKHDKRCTCNTEFTNTNPVVRKITSHENEYEIIEECGKAESSENVMCEGTSSLVASVCKGTSDSVSEETSGNSSSLLTCICCKGKYTPDSISLLGSTNENYPLCAACFKKRPILTSLCYAGPEHTCRCYKQATYMPVRTDILNEIKNTVKELHNLEYCTCTKPSRVRDSNYCQYCRFKLRNTSRTKQGIAYTLTLEDECPYKLRRKRKKQPLEEIRLKVQCPYNRKKHKDKENSNRKDTACDQCDSTKATRTDVDAPKLASNCQKVRCRTNFTLQDYLKKNRPEFVEAADNRRTVVLNSKCERILAKDEFRSKFIEDKVPAASSNAKRSNKLFTEQEMRAITKRNYKKLPEVQEKLNNVRERKLRNADRYIVDVFTRKIRRSVLQGKSRFPIDANVVCLPNSCNNC